MWRERTKHQTIQLLNTTIIRTKLNNDNNFRNELVDMTSSSPHHNIHEREKLKLDKNVNEHNHLTTKFYNAKKKYLNKHMHLITKLTHKKMNSAAWSITHISHFITKFIEPK